jgi:nitrite reductase/ring-hydroxylating ferredoxin subunit
MCCGTQRKSLPGKSPGKDWFQVATMRDFEQGKITKPVILANNQVAPATRSRVLLHLLTLPTTCSCPKSHKVTPYVPVSVMQAIIVWLIAGELFCSDANSTAFQFPLVDGKISSRAGGPAVEVPLDGTVYDLGTGEVLEWVPKNTPIRAVLNTLKSSAKPESLRVYPVQKDESGRIYVNV